MSPFSPVLLSLPSFTPSLAVEILPYGLTIHRVYVQADGRTHDIVIGPEAPEDHAVQKYTNSIVGRYTNRIPVGKHQIERKGIKGEITSIANESPKVSLHGGPVGFDAVVWERISSATLFSKAELAHLPESADSWAIFRLVSPDGDQGFPGALQVEALISLVGPGEQEKIYVKPGEKANESGVEYDLGSIILVYRAKLIDGTVKSVTPVNLTQHWGFNLDASLRADSLSVEDHILTVKADRVTELDSDSLATGVFLPTANTHHAHNHTAISSRLPAAGYDDFYLFTPPAAPPTPTRLNLTDFTPESDLLKYILRPSNDPTISEAQRRGSRSDPVVELASHKSGLKLVFDSNQSGVMFYTNNLSDPANGSRKKIHGGSGNKGDGYPKYSAAFLEFHEPLAAFLDPKNKDANDTLLTSEELYNSYCRLDVKFYETRPESSTPQ